MRSASGNENDLAIHCRAVLDAAQRAGHLVLRTPSIGAEWDKHASGFALRWIVEMQSRRRVLDVDESETGLAGALDNLPVQVHERKIMLKDCHLLEAAQAAEQRVISTDEAAYFHFYHASARISQLQKIMWASPMRMADECVQWLAAGAKPEAKRKIGRRPHRSHPGF